MDNDAPYRVLLIDDDADIASVVVAILTDEGYAVSVLVDTSHESILAAVGKQEPDCVLLDGSTAIEYGPSWADAAYLAARARSIPTIMFTAHVRDIREAQEAQSERAVAADFSAVVAKLFSLDELLIAVAEACGKSTVFNTSADGDRERTVALAHRLRQLGATDIRTSDRREWATFRPSGAERISQLYWWQRLGVYLVGAYGEHGMLAPIGQFFELEAAIAAAMVHGPADDGDSPADHSP